MKNTLTDLNNHLFAQMERLSEEGISSETIEQEVKRSEAIVKISDAILDNAKTHISACKLMAEHGDRFANQMPMVAAPSVSSKPQSKIPNYRTGESE